GARARTKGADLRSAGVEAFLPRKPAWVQIPPPAPNFPKFLDVLRRKITFITFNDFHVFCF
ncbi:MAG: hypothetical protein B6U75_02080, partial [Desulfurococcales archaeon ex4484_217_1]